jgi:hypothetical protein
LKAKKDQEKPKATKQKRRKQKQKNNYISTPKKRTKSKLVMK